MFIYIIYPSVCHQFQFINLLVLLAEFLYFRFCYQFIVPFGSRRLNFNILDILIFFFFLSTRLFKILILLISD